MKYNLTIDFKLLHPDAKLPFKAHDGDAGFDLCSIENHLISGQGVIKIRTGLQLANIRFSDVSGSHIDVAQFLPLIKIEGRSSLAAKGIFPVGGIIEPTEEIIVILASFGYSLHIVNIGDSVGKLVAYNVSNANIYLNLQE